MEHRKEHRFSSQRPALLKVRGESGSCDVHGIAENVGENGVLFVGESEIPLGAEVEATITLPHEVRALASGRVVRVERRSGGKKTAVAVQCNHPFSESVGAVDSTPNLTLTAQSQVGGNVFILRCQGRIVRGHEAGAFRTRALHLLAAASKIVVDLKGVEHIDSTGIGVLAGLLTSAKRQGADIKLASPSQRAKDLLHRTRLDTVFKVYETDAEAVVAFPAQGMNSGGAG